MSGEVAEISSARITPRPAPTATVVPAPPPQQAVACPPTHYSTPSYENLESKTNTFSLGGGSPIRKVLSMTKLEKQDNWLPITESRNGNAFYAAFHTLCSGIGVQALLLPIAFSVLGWTWGIISLVVIFIWQYYTLWVLVQLHESTETGVRHSRYLQLFGLTFGKKLQRILCLFPILYLSAGTCVALIILGGATSKIFFQIACGPGCTVKSLTPVQWYLVFTCAAVILSQLPNMNSIAGVSLVGTITAVGFCTIMWVVSVTEGRMPHVSYDPVRAKTATARDFGILNAIGLVAFAFRGHNLILEIQATMPSSKTYPSRIPMWRGVKFAYLIIAMCIFPVAIAGYWAYGRMIPANGGLLTAMYAFHSRDVSRFVMGLMSMLIIVNAVTSFQIYNMPMYDLFESIYTRRKDSPCPWWVRVIMRSMIGFGCFFVAIAIPFLGSLAGLIGGIALPVTLAYPCFMWLKIKKPMTWSAMWWINLGLGLLGMALSGILISAGIYVVFDVGIKWNFFKPL